MPDPTALQPDASAATSNDATPNDASTLDPPSIGAAALPPLDPLLGRYRLSGRVLGEGGSGVVELAWDTFLDREVAVKQLHDAGEDIGRFLREARLTARLEHPGIVPIHEVGRRPDGRPYYTMRVVRGRTLQELLRGADPAARQALVPALLGVCQTVGFAHQRGVVHRDLKPANIMIGPLGEAVVLDWGLARADTDRTAIPELTGEDDHTAMGLVLGTPGWLSPEQARGEPATARSDVWSLGAILFELLEGQRLLDGPREERVRRAAAGDYPGPGRGPPELQAICRRALSLRPEDRYPDAAALSTDIAAWLSGNKVGSYKYSWRDELLRALRQNRAAVSVGLLMGLLLLLGGILSIRSILHERDRALQSEKQRSEELRATWAGDAAEALDHKNVVDAWLLAARSLNLGEHPGTRGILLAADSGWMPLSLARAPAPPGRCFDFAWRDRTLAAACDTGVWIDEGDRGRFLAATDPAGGLSPRIETVAWHGETLLAGDRSGRLWSLEAGSLQVSRHRPGDWVAVRSTLPGVAVLALPVKGIPLDGSLRMGSPIGLPVPNELPQRWSPDGSQVAAGGYGGLCIYAWPSGQELHCFDAKGTDVRHLAWSPDGGSLWAGGAQTGGQEAVWRWSVGSRSPRSVLRVEGRVSALAPSPDGRWLVMLSDADTLAVYEIDTGTLVARLPARGASALSFSPAGEELVVAGAAGIDRWALPTDLRSASALLGEGAVAAVGMVGEQAVVVDVQGTVHRLDFSNGQSRGEMSTGWGLGSGNALVERDGRVIIGAGSGDIFVVQGDALVGRYKVGGRISGIVPLPDGGWAFGVGARVSRLDPSWAETRSCSLGIEGQMTEGVVSPAPEVAVATAEDHLVAVSLNDCHIIGESPDAGGTLAAIALHPDGCLIFGGDSRGLLHVWTWPELKPIQALRSHDHRPTAFAWTGGGQRWASADEGGGLRIWEGEDRLLASFDAHEQAVWGLSFDDAGSHLASASSDRSVGLWRLDRLDRPGVDLAQEGALRFAALLSR